VVPLVQWLSQFRQPASLMASITSGVMHAVNSSASVGAAGEITVESAAVLLSGVVTELSPGGGAAAKGSAASEEMVYNLVQLCMLLRLLGSGNESGLVKIAEVASLLEDTWLLSMSDASSGRSVVQVLAQLRYAVLQQSTKKAGSTPRKHLDEVLAGILALKGSASGTAASASVTVADTALFNAPMLTLVVNKFLPGCSAADTADLVTAILRIGAWNDSATAVTALDLRELLCTLCSYRNIQKRLQTWFRAVPTIYQSLVAAVNAHPDPRAVQKEGEIHTSVEVFCDAVQASNLPLTTAESFMLSQLLTRKSGGGRDAGSHVEVQLLLKIKKGEFLNANLA